MAIPVFSIHGNHDDPSGVRAALPIHASSNTYNAQEGHLAALDILQMSGLINYYGRTPESDNILVKPVLFQKGNTKLALYGMSNVRDERLFRTFRDGNVKFFQPGTQKGDWFNLMSVHQNHHAYTDTGYLPEHFLPDFLDLVVWGHEHECKIDPLTNPETNFRVMQPGSSVATSLVPGEAVEKKVAIVSVRGKDFDVETIRLKTVRPFIYKEITLADDRRMRDLAHDDDNQSKIHAYLTDIVNRMIEEAKDSWLELQQETGEEPDGDVTPPLPLIRLRVEYTAPEGGKYEIENPQRFSNRFVERVANTSDVVQFHRKKAAASRAIKGKPDMPDVARMAELSLDNVKVEELVEEFLTAQSLTILPSAEFSHSVGLYVDKDDKHAMVEFIGDQLEKQVKSMVDNGEDDVDEDRILELMEQFKQSMEEAYARGELKRSRRKGSRKPKPDGWDSELDGEWENDPASIIRSGDEMQAEDDDEESAAPKKTSGRARGGKAAAGSTRKTAATTAKKAPAKAANGRSRKKQVSEDEEDEEEDVVMLDDDEEDDDEGIFVPQTKKPPAKKTTTAKAAAKPSARGTPKPSTRGAKTAAPTGRQSQLNFGSQSNGAASRTTNGRAAAPKQRLQEPSEDEISDDDAFEPPAAAVKRGARR